MRQNFNLTESEKEQILNMHRERGYGKPLNEQSGDDFQKRKYSDEEMDAITKGQMDHDEQQFRRETGGMYDEEPKNEKFNNTYEWEMPSEERLLKKYRNDMDGDYITVYGKFNQSFGVSTPMVGVAKILRNGDKLYVDLDEILFKTRNRSGKENINEGFGGNFSKENNPIDNPSEDIDWDYPSEKIIAKDIKLGNSYVDVYGTAVHNDETIHYRGYAKILEGGEIDLDNVIEVEIDDSWEPSDDQMMNRGNYEGGIRYGDGDKWQGR